MNNILSLIICDHSKLCSFIKQTEFGLFLLKLVECGFSHQLRDRAGTQLPRTTVQWTQMSIIIEKLY